MTSDDPEKTNVSYQEEPQPVPGKRARGPLPPWPAATLPAAPNKQLNRKTSITRHSWQALLPLRHWHASQEEYLFPAAWWKPRFLRFPEGSLIYIQRKHWTVWWYSHCVLWMGKIKVLWNFDYCCHCSLLTVLHPILQHFVFRLNFCVFCHLSWQSYSKFKGQLYKSGHPPPSP